MTILLITYHYPPDRAVGGHRARKVVEALRDAGHHVSIVAAGNSPSVDPVQRIEPLPSVRDVYAIFRNSYAVVTKRQDLDRDEGAASTSPSMDIASVPFWKRWIFSLIWLPDDRQGFILPTVRRGLRLSDGRPDLIYTTAPPFSVHLAGLILRVLTGARWVAEFRDPWTANPWKPAHMRSLFSDWLERELEWLCLETADMLVSVSEGIAERLTDRGTGTPIRVVRNGIEDLRPAEGMSAELGTDGPFNIVYAGSFYHTRDPFPFLDAVQHVVAGRSLRPEDLRVRFIGATESYGGQSIEEYIRSAGLDEHVRLEGWVEPGRALGYVRTADLLLLLALDQPDQVPNKLYEYLGVRRPILAVVDEDGESARMLKRVGGHHIVPVNDAARIRRALEDLLDEGRTGPVGDPTVLAEWTTTAQMAGLPRALEALAEGRADSWSYRAP